MLINTNSEIEDLKNKFEIKIKVKKINKNGIVNEIRTTIPNTSNAHKNITILFINNDVYFKPTKST